MDDFNDDDEGDMKTAESNYCTTPSRGTLTPPRPLFTPPRPPLTPYLKVSTAVNYIGSVQYSLVEYIEIEMKQRYGIVSTSSSSKCPQCASHPRPIHLQ